MKNPNTTNWNNYKYQRNFCTNLQRKTKFDYFRSLNVKDLNDNKKFWQKIKHFFSDECLASGSIILKEKGDLITDNQKLENLFNTYFINITDTLQLKKSPLKFLSHSKIISFYENHDGISKIKENDIPKKFCFKKVSSNAVKKIIKSLNRKKSAITSCIPVSILINSMDIYLPLLTDIIINYSLKRGIFLDDLKLAEVILYSFDRTNYRPVSLVFHSSKVFERIIYNQINEYIEPCLSKVLTGFCKNHNTQHSLLKMLENFKEALDKGNSVSVIFMDLSKVFDTLNHDLIFLVSLFPMYIAI